jgi:hypothetical protein
MNINDEVIKFNDAFNKEIIEISVITESRSFSSVKSKNEEYFEHKIKLVAWKYFNSNEIYTGDYILTLKADRDYINKLRKRIMPDSIVSLKVRQKENMFLFIEILETDSLDKELEKLLPQKGLKEKIDELKEPSPEQTGRINIIKELGNLQKETRKIIDKKEYIRVIVEYKVKGEIKEREMKLYNVQEGTEEAIRAIKLQLPRSSILWNINWYGIPDWMGRSWWYTFSI